MTGLDDLSLARSAVDRSAHLRVDDAALSAMWSDPGSRVLVVGEGAALVTMDDPPRLVLRRPDQVGDGERYLLGVDDDGVAYLALAVDAQPRAAVSEDAKALGLREVGAVLDARDAGLLVHAVALANWHATHRHCPRCGAPTVVAAAGHVRRCTADGSEHYPRTDPAVIMTVVDADDRVLLGRQAAWPEGRYSTLAGFVEPGESLEMAVRREVAEEVGVVVGEVTYLGSQPWPFPSSLMLGFTGRAVSTRIAVDGLEIAEARWFTRAELDQAVAAGTLRLPPPVSIARRLVEAWYGAPLDDGRTGW